MSPAYTMPEHCPDDSAFMKDTFHSFMAAWPMVVGHAFTFVLGFWITSIPEERQKRMYPSVVVVWAFVQHGTQIWLAFSRERAWSSGAPIVLQGVCTKVSHISVIRDHSKPTFFPERKCIDRDQLKTVTQWPFPLQLGCERMLPDSTLPRSFDFLFVLQFLRVDWSTTLLITVLTGAQFVIGSWVVGWGDNGWHLIYQTGLHLCIGCVSARSCVTRSECILLVSNVFSGSRMCSLV